MIFTSPSWTSIVPERFASFERVLNPFERLALAEQAQERLALEVEQMLLTDHCRVRQVAAREDVGELAADERVVIGRSAAAPGEMHPELERRAQRRPAYRNRRFAAPA